jgi:carboxylesterase type B
MDSNRIEIYVQEGKLIGIVENCTYGDNYTAFRGIPYAKPPIGELRFKDPVPAEPWSGDRDASKHGNVAVQLHYNTHEIVGDEDCLYLNVYTAFKYRQSKIDSSEKRAVMVWIHGGGYHNGSGDEVFFGPDYIVQKDVVLVTLNYRLGVLGFLNLNDKVATGNQGLKDVIMALRWVQKNISNFGGDPKNVTIFGESAGGVIAHCLTLSPLAKDLFHKAIMQSGVITCPWAFMERQSHLINIGFRLAEKLGKTTTDPKVACEFLKTIDAKKLIETQQTFILTEIDFKQRYTIFTPSWDYESSNPVFPEDPLSLVYRGIKVPLLLGFVNCEGTILISSNFVVSACKHINKEDLEIINSDFEKTILPGCSSTLSRIPIRVEDLRSKYFGDKAISEETIMNYVDFLSDLYFCRGIMEVVDIQAKLNNINNKATYLYKFSYDSETSPMKKIFDIRLPGASHTEELGYLFYPYIMKKFGMSPPTIDSEDYKMINYLTQMWTDFAKTGNPTPASNLWLPLVGSHRDKYNYLNIDTNLQMKFFYKGEERWD